MPDYKFEFGNSTDGPMGFVAWQYGENKEDALERLRERLWQQDRYGMSDVTADVELIEGRYYVSVYISPENIRLDHIVEVEPDEAD